MTSPSRSTEQHFQVLGLRLVAQRWNAGAPVRVIALHGWLDNSESFSAIAGSMPDVDLVALDMAGHGLSDHRAAHASYLIWDDLREILAVAGALGWSHFGLLGHSRGAIVASLLASACPDRIQALGLIDGLWAQTCETHRAPAQLARGLGAAVASTADKEPLFHTLEEMVALRVRSGFPISAAAAHSLVQRNAIQGPDGWRWRTDARLKLPSMLMLTPELQDAFLQAIRIPVQLILAENGLVLAYPDYADRLARLPAIRWQLQAGGHHLHMEGAGPALGQIFNGFFQAA